MAQAGRNCREASSGGRADVAGANRLRKAARSIGVILAAVISDLIDDLRRERDIDMPTGILNRWRRSHARGVSRPCLLSEREPDVGDLTTAVLGAETDPASADFFLCGGADPIGRLKRELFLKGANYNGFERMYFCLRRDPPLIDQRSRELRTGARRSCHRADEARASLIVAAARRSRMACSASLCSRLPNPRRKPLPRHGGAANDLE